MLTTKLVTTDEELKQIAALSAANLVTNISQEQKIKEGFVTWVYPLEVLQTLHKIIPSVIAMDGDKLAGYAITLTKECADAYPPIAENIEYIKTVFYKGRPLSDYRLYFMGQICVEENYRGQGVVNLLYNFHKQQFSPLYDIFFTEISPANPRSLKAHQKVGFQVIDTHRDSTGEWDAVIWDWTIPS
ncbi:MAG: GNAT family N-acetyltransferase [Bacteroidetes bacterium]|nr:GNAT family N-acetyltransferase [Bacteroidota bacterium]